ncbi:hypothetical protein ID866_9970 [Astraeus odoratus]|nr:hypothetical protein ID866_9970 [Astraeus odoratus]
MALNWVMFDSIRNPVPLQDESTITTLDAECTLIIPDTTGNSGGASHSKIKESGKMYLTSKRLVFASQSTSSKAKASFESLSIPLDSILSSNFEQPFFGANYLVLGVKPSPGGGLANGTTLEIRSLNSGLFAFVSLLEKTREKAIYMRRHSVDDEENLPAYSSSGTAGGSSQYEDMPPGYDA